MSFLFEMRFVNVNEVFVKINVTDPNIRTMNEF